MNNKQVIRISENQLKQIVTETIKRILNEEVDIHPVSPHFKYDRDREIVQKLENEGWVGEIWNHLNPRLFNLNGDYIIRVCFFDYTYCVGKKDFLAGTLENCRNIIQNIILNGKCDDEEFKDFIEDSLYEFEGDEEENGERIDSVGFDIYSPDGRQEVGDARGQHRLSFLFQ